MRIEFRARCPRCLTERIGFGFEIKNPTPEDMNRLEEKIDKRGGFLAECPRCGSTEEVAMFDDGHQTEPWTDANEYERRNGPDAGPPPPKPWEKNK